MNEPVAWMREDGVIAFHAQKEVDSQGYKWQPLYTHPVKEQELLDEIAHLKHLNRNWQISENILLLELEKLQDHPVKDLTDEEIALIWANYGVPMTGMDFKKVVEAILRKAQEK